MPLEPDKTVITLRIRDSCMQVFVKTNTAVGGDSVSYKFGLVCMFAGALGVPLGSWLAQRLRARFADADPLICGFALLASSPIVYLALVAAASYAVLTYVLIFCGMITLNLTWSIVADIILVSVF